ncbi:MAG: hypothetical protein BGO82_18750 [Devosia sp. 67-54]|uniref:hypothetical protein n=1 Tax=unclassified Devosia TaxID=196773 RepID=UPI000968070A|nr:MULTISPECIES: hypothetical protein [unclassified Devosia]MBN9304416.1 hypothetical protein [Devosia sp.]OJX18216.1 MAG: hypothetical protein BGO82_18750 [Devosia sp. 67-54]
MAAAWLFGIPFALLLALYVVLLVHPLPLPFLAGQLRNVVVASMPKGTELELGDMALALEGYAWPVIQFSPVVYKDTASGAKIGMQALEVGFSPVRALIGQPGATVTVVGPHIQINQDLFGPRLADLEVVPDPNGGPATVRVLEGSTAFPDAGIHAGGIDVRGEQTEATHMRSDNDWLVFNLEAAEAGISSIIEQAEMGRFSRLVIKNATVDMNDAVYGFFRTFTDINLDIAPTPNGKAVEGSFSANFGGTVMQGMLERVLNDKGEARMKVSLNNFDLASFAPMINDPDSMVGIVGASAISLDIGFDAKTSKIHDGDFHVDMTGTDLRFGDNYFPIASNIIEVRWTPQTGTFDMDAAALTMGALSAKMKGVFKLGLDELYGPTVGISMSASDIKVQSPELGDTQPVENMSFKGWSAPLYGAVGIDQAILSGPDGTRIESKGRLDLLRKGLGFDMAVAAQNVDVSALKAMWPDFLGPDARAWFLKSVVGGKLESANMKFAFPVGTLDMNNLTRIPQNGVFVEMVADGVKVKPFDSMAPIEIIGKTRLQMHDSEITLAADGGQIQTRQGNIEVANAAVVMTPGANAGEQLVELSGDVSSKIPALSAILAQVQPDPLQGQKLPVDIDTLDGNLNVRLLSTLTLDAQMQTKKIDYTINGNVVDFGSSAPIQGHSFSDGQLSFMATPAGFRVGGSAAIDGVTASATVEGDLKDPRNPNTVINATVDLGDLGKLGYDVSQFATGKVALLAKPLSDGSIDVAVDLKNAALNIKDLGISKAAGVAGSASGNIKQAGNTTDVSKLQLGFGDVKLEGGLEIDAKKGLQSAEFTNFALSPGDAAQISLTPINGGYAVRVRGDQLDLKPLLKRSFSLEQGSAGPQATSFTQTLAIDAELKRALGFYATTAYNMSLNLALKGSDLKKVSLQAQLTGNSTVSVVTNPTPEGRSMSVVFNDLGTLLRLVGVYAQLQGGDGSLLLTTDSGAKVDTGVVNIKNFAIVDEKNVANILGGHPEGVQLLSRGNNLAFRSAQVDFTHRVDRVQINNAVVTGDSIGGSGKGFIYTDSKQYDLVGTVIPMFGINNAFGKLFGPLGGGPAGGLFGITFQVKGPLDKPDFRINPMSALAPGAFRSLFEYRAKEQPRVE